MSSTTITSTPSPSSPPPPYPYSVNLANFISVKLTGHENYHIWKTQFLCLIEAHDLLGFINDDTAEEDSYAWRRTDVLLRGWILCSLSEDVLGGIITLNTAKDVWDSLEDLYSSPLILESGGVKEEMKFSGGLMRSPPIRGVSQQIDLKGDSVTPGVDGSMKKLSGLGKSFSWEPDDCRHGKATKTCLVQLHRPPPHAQEFLLAIPIDGLGQHMSPIEYRTILKYRLMIPIFPVDEICPVCHKACLDSFGEHAVHCRELPGFKYRHDLVRDVLFDIFRRAEISVKKEASVNFLTDPMEGRSTLRPADILVFGWIGGKHACVDLTGVSPLVGLGNHAFTAGQAALKAASCKVTKHEKACLDNQHAFIPFAFDTFGFLASEAVELLKRVQRVMHGNVTTPSIFIKCLTEPPANVSAYLPLYKAALRGYWDDAQYIIDRDEKAITANINKYGFTALHIAVGTGKQGITFVEKLVERISPISLLEMLTSSEKYTPLHIAAVVGNTAAVEILVNRNPMLLYAEDVDGLLPIHRSLINSHRETFLYLLDVTKDDQFPSAFTDNMGVTLLSNVIFAGYFDTALDLCTRYPELATTKPSDNVDAPLMAIARKADAFESGCRLNFIDRLIYKYVPLKWENLDSNRKHGKMNFHSSDLQKTSLVIWKFLGKIVPRITHIQKMKVVHHQAVALVKLLCQEISALNLQSNSIHYANPIIEAASNGAYEVVQEIADAFPQAIWYSDISGYFLIQLAIIHRCETVYNLTYQMSDHKHFHKTLKDPHNNNLLHLAGRLAPRHKLNLVSGAALQMQRELQWFKEVEAFVHPKYRTEKNTDGKTPKMLFRKEHKKLVKAGEEWMKKTADSYTVTAGLITTIVFAAAITVPGGNSGETGHPIYAKELSFLIFAVADAISLFTSTTSLLLFLSILTARYAEEDFLFTLPSRLIMGLSTLFVSTCSMMIAFGASLYLLFGQGKEWILIPIAALSCLPITCFVTLQFPLLVELISCTYGRGLFGKQSNRPFY